MSAFAGNADMTVCTANMTPSQDPLSRYRADCYDQYSSVRGPDETMPIRTFGRGRLAMNGGSGKKPSHAPMRYWLIAGLLLIGIAIAVAWFGINATRGVAVVKDFKEYLDSLQNDELKRIGSIILDDYNEYRRDARNWSAVTFGSLFLSAALSACAGVILKLEFFLRNEPFKKDLAAVMAMLAALLITLSTVGDFHQRWTSNRLAAAKMERLAYIFMAAGRTPDLASFSDQIQAIAFERNEGIVLTERKEGIVSTKSERQTK